MNVKLELENGCLVESPSPKDIERELRTLKESGNSYAILSKDKDHFLQTAVDTPDRFELEFNGGRGMAGLRQAADASIPLQRVIGAFQDYAAGGEGWRHSFRWEPLKERGLKTASKLILLTMAFSIIGLLVAVMKF
jgi:hypothetical protein